MKEQILFASLCIYLNLFFIMIKLNYIKKQVDKNAVTLEYVSNCVHRIEGKTKKAIDQCLQDKN